MEKNILWWGRYDHGYSRNRILLRVLERLGYRCENYRPENPLSAYFDQWFDKIGIIPDAIWVPAFRQNDVMSARRYADKHDIPLVFDPLISAWDKAVFERQKFHQRSFRSKRLLKWERSIFSKADLVLADTDLHAKFYAESLGVSPAKIATVLVGVEESLFKTQPPDTMAEPLEVLFYGSFIHLQGPEIIAEAAKKAPEIEWRFLGNGPLRCKCEEICAGCDNVQFEDWIPYEQLPERIGRAAVLLGIFGTTEKPGRVIPNKVFQALACGRPVVTRSSLAYPAGIDRCQGTGIYFVEAGNPDALVSSIRKIIGDKNSIPDLGKQARGVYERCFSEGILEESVCKALAVIGI